MAIGVRLWTLPLEGSAEQLLTRIPGDVKSRVHDFGSNPLPPPSQPLNPNSSVLCGHVWTEGVDLEGRGKVTGSSSFSNEGIFGEGH